MKRKQIDIERQCSVLEIDESRPIQRNVRSLPEFHISGFEDSSLANSSVREVAIVITLQELLKEYDRLEGKDSVKGDWKLEAQMDDGLDNCASSLSYAVHWMMKGVSSSREV